MRYVHSLIWCCAVVLSCGLGAAEVTVCSYNCGGLADHYDYLRASAMQKLMQERYNAEPEAMAEAEEMQRLALKILFAQDPRAAAAARRRWEEGGYQALASRLTAAPTVKGSPNAPWHQKVEAAISSYKVRPVVIGDSEVAAMVVDQVRDVTAAAPNLGAALAATRDVMARRIFAHQLKYDIICLQEADYIDVQQLPARYDGRLSSSDHSINGVLWDKGRYSLDTDLGDVMGRAYVVRLRDRENGKLLLVASGHISGCNPFQRESDPVTLESDSQKGDGELTALLALLDAHEGDLKVVAMDSNVTALHPRLCLLKEGGYRLDSDHFVDPTCANPHQVLNTRIDWIAVKGDADSVAIHNIPVLNVGLNSIQTNISDHKPVAAKISY